MALLTRRKILCSSSFGIAVVGAGCLDQLPFLGGDHVDACEDLVADYYPDLSPDTIPDGIVLVSSSDERIADVDLIQTALNAAVDPEAERAEREHSYRVIVHIQSEDRDEVIDRLNQLPWSEPDVNENDIRLNNGFYFNHAGSIIRLVCSARFV